MNGRLPTTLKEKSTGKFVPAEIATQLGFGELVDAEKLWAPYRLDLIKRLHEQGIPPADWPQHWHWNWVQKFAVSGLLDEGKDLSPYRLMGMYAQDVCQGLVLATSAQHVSRIDATGKDVLYVNYLETAPWNLAVEHLQHSPRLVGVGRQLLAQCILLSREIELKGRVGLHALPQANDCYRRWNMTDLGPDGRCHSLNYFEMTTDQADVFLNGGTS